MEAISRNIDLLVPAGITQIQPLERRLELAGTGLGAARDGIVVDVDLVDGVGAVLVSVHGEPGAVEAEVVLLPFVAQHARFALLHPAGTADVVDGGGRHVVRGSSGGLVLFDARHGEAGVAPVAGVRGGALDGGEDRGGGVAVVKAGWRTALLGAGRGPGDGEPAAVSHVWWDG